MDKRCLCAGFIRSCSFRIRPGILLEQGFWECAGNRPDLRQNGWERVESHQGERYWVGLMDIKGLGNEEYFKILWF